jgi:hypothetical protein
MADEFKSSKLRLARGKDHIFDLKKRISAFFETHPYSFLIEPDPNGINQQHKIKLIKPLPDDWTLMVTEAVEHFRAVLDQAVYAMLGVTRIMKPSATKFPIGNNVSDFEKRAMKDFPDHVKPFFRAFEPYKGGDNLLWALNGIANANKHRMLTFIDMASNTIEFGSLDIEFSDTMSIPMPRWDRTKNEIIFLVTGPETKLTYNNVKIALDVAFNEVEIVEGQPVIAVLNLLASKVENILIAIEAKARILGVVT